MSKEKQIEEMAWYMCDIPKHPSITSCEKCNCQGKCHPMYYAVRAYNADYRKQKRGEWIQQMRPYDDFIECSSCGEWFNIIDNCTEKFKFCPNCGARMKDGAE